MSRGKEGDLGGTGYYRGGALPKGPKFLPMWSRHKTAAEVDMNAVGRAKRQAKARARAKAAKRARKKNR